jgi:hypothetical protein
MDGIQSANAGPGLLLHEAVSASPFFETDTVPLGQVTEASVSPEPQATVQLWLLFQYARERVCSTTSSGYLWRIANDQFLLDDRESLSTKYSSSPFPT